MSPQNPGKNSYLKQKNLNKIFWEGQPFLMKSQNFMLLSQEAHSIFVLVVISCGIDVVLQLLKS